MLMQEAITGSKSLFGFSMPSQRQLKAATVDQVETGEVQSPGNEDDAEREVESVASEVSKRSRRYRTTCRRTDNTRRFTTSKTISQKTRGEARRMANVHLLLKGCTLVFRNK